MKNLLNGQEMNKPVKFRVNNRETEDEDEIIEIIENYWRDIIHSGQAQDHQRHELDNIRYMLLEEDERITEEELRGHCKVEKR